jgi:hypothetical protein
MDAVHITPPIRALASTAVRWLGDYVSVHWRLGDKKNDPYFLDTPDSLMQWLTALSAQAVADGRSANLTVYVALEDEHDALVPPLVARATASGHRVLLWSDLVRALFWPNLDQPTYVDRILHFGPAVGMVEVQIMAHARHFRWATTSTMSEFVLLTRLTMPQHRCSAITQLQGWDDTWQKYVATSYPPFTSTRSMRSQVIPRCAYVDDTNPTVDAPAFPTASAATVNASHAAISMDEPDVKTQAVEVEVESAPQGHSVSPSLSARLFPLPPLDCLWRVRCGVGYTAHPAGFKPPMPMTRLADQVWRDFVTPLDASGDRDERIRRRNNRTKYDEHDAVAPAVDGE